MHLAYGAADGNGRAAVRLYREGYPKKPVPNHQTLRVCTGICVKLQLSTETCMAQVGWEVRALLPLMKRLYSRWNSTKYKHTTRVVGHRLRVPQPTVWKVLHENRLNTFYLHRVQSLHAGGYLLRIEFARWYVQQSAVLRLLFSSQTKPLSHVMVCLMCTMFMFGRRNVHMLREHMLINNGSPSVFGRVSSATFLIGPYLLSTWLKRRIYRMLLEKLLSEILNYIPVSLCVECCFSTTSQRGAAHFRTDVRNILNSNFVGPMDRLGWTRPLAPTISQFNMLSFFLLEILRKTRLRDTHQLRWGPRRKSHCRCCKCWGHTWNFSKCTPINASLLSSMHYCWLSFFWTATV